MKQKALQLSTESNSDQLEPNESPDRPVMEIQEVGESGSGNESFEGELELSVNTIPSEKIYTTSQSLRATRKLD